MERLPQVIPFGGDETNRKLVSAQLTRGTKFRTRTSMTAGLKWNMIQVKTWTWLINPLGDGCISSGSGGVRGWVIAFLYLLERPSLHNDSHSPSLEAISWLSEN